MKQAVERQWDGAGDPRDAVFELFDVQGVCAEPVVRADAGEWGESEDLDFAVAVPPAVF